MNLLGQKSNALNDVRCIFVVVENVHLLVGLRGFAVQKKVVMRELCTFLLLCNIF